MSFALVLVLIALAGLVAAVWTMARGLLQDDAAYRRAQKRGGLGLAALLLALGIVQVGQTERVVQRLTAPEEDGSWNAVSIDGRPVAAGAWRISVERGRVSGGRDDCNDWGYQEPQREGGQRLIVSTLVGCREDDPARRGYWAMATAPDAVLELRGDGRLRLAARGHEGLFRRCRWTREAPPPGSRSTARQVCL
ncbi:MAG TPA: hypothetical protein VD887_06570 [Allosphingosinicella sp.]|nr:hypothetical protein [Allosphingosinicella sp.]